jgi:hypothetical protein
MKPHERERIERDFVEETNRQIDRMDSRKLKQLTRAIHGLPGAREATALLIPCEYFSNIPPDTVAQCKVLITPRRWDEAIAEIERPPESDDFCTEPTTH